MLTRCLQYTSLPGRLYEIMIWRPRRHVNYHQQRSPTRGRSHYGVNMKRRDVLQLLGSSLLILPLGAAAAAPFVEVYKSASCGCCQDWIEHLEANGFKVKTHNVASPSDYRRKFGIPEQLGSCHTGVVAGYALEGHVPASDIKRLLAEKPKARGLAVAGMPHGSPGMEGRRNDPYDVLLVQANGKYSVYKHYN